MITCKDVWYDFSPEEQQQENWAIQNINLTIQPGEYVCIVGPNGSGKSTLAKLLKGLLIPNRGSICIGNKNSQNPDDQWEIRQKVGLVFQNPDHQIVASTVEDDIAFGLENISLSVDEMKKRIDSVLNEVGLVGLNKKEPHHLSGGQKQRLAIASVIAMQPEIVIFDEATSMLDPQGTKDVLSVIKQLHQQKKTIIYITHHMEEITNADRIILMAKGRIQLDISPSELIAYSDYFEKNEIELPIYIQLCKQLYEKGWPIKRDISNKDELVGEIWKLLLKN